MIYEFILVAKGWKVDDKSKMKWNEKNMAEESKQITDILQWVYYDNSTDSIDTAWNWRFFPSIILQ